MPDTDPDGFSRRVDDIAGTTRRILATVSVTRGTVPVDFLSDDLVRSTVTPFRLPMGDWSHRPAFGRSRGSSKNRCTHQGLLLALLLPAKWLGALSTAGLVEVQTTAAGSDRPDSHDAAWVLNPQPAAGPS